MTLPILYLTHALIFLATVAGLAHLATGARLWLSTCRLVAVGAVVSQVAWLTLAGMVFPYCVLRDAWGMMAFVTILGIATAGAAGLKWGTPRFLIATLVLLSVAVGTAHAIYPQPAASTTVPMGVVLPLHILLTVLGYTAMTVGCVAGFLFLVRSHALKRGGAVSNPGVPWPALTTLDRLFVRSTGWGAFLLAGGIALGVGALPRVSAGALWYADPKVILTILGCLVYAWVWWIRRRQGFCSNTVVGLGTLGFALILLAFLAPDLFARGLHHF